MNADEIRKSLNTDLWNKKRERERTKEASEKASDGCLAGAREVSDERLDSARGLSGEELSDIHGPSRRIKSTRINEKDPPIGEEKTNWRRIGEWSALFLVFAGSGSIIRGMPYRISATYFLGAAACMISSDGLGLFGRCLAPQTRAIISAMVIVFGSALHIRSNDFRMAAGILILIGTAVSMIANKYWIEAYNHMMCPEVKKAMKNDPRNRAAKAWEEKGAKQCWSIAWELGHKASDFTITCLFKIYWLAGFWTGLEKNNIQKVKQERLDQLEDENKIMQKHLETALDELDACEEALEDYKTKQQEHKADVYYLNQTIYDLREKLQQAMTTKAAPVAADVAEDSEEDEPEVVLQTKEEKVKKASVDVDAKEAEINEIIERYLKRGYSTRDIKSLGVFKSSYVDQASKRYNEEKREMEKVAENVA